MGVIRFDGGVAAALRAGCDEATAPVGAYVQSDGGVAGDVIAQWETQLRELGVQVKHIPISAAATAQSIGVTDESAAVPFGDYL